jgi:hypothetical protein
MAAQPEVIPHLDRLSWQDLSGLGISLVHPRIGFCLFKWNPFTPATS